MGNCFFSKIVTEERLSYGANAEATSGLLSGQRELEDSVSQRLDYRGAEAPALASSHPNGQKGLTEVGTDHPDAAEHQHSTWNSRCLQKHRWTQNEATESLSRVRTEQYMPRTQQEQDAVHCVEFAPHRAENGWCCPPARPGGHTDRGQETWDQHGQR